MGLGGRLFLTPSFETVVVVVCRVDQAPSIRISLILEDLKADLRSVEEFTSSGKWVRFGAAKWVLVLCKGSIRRGGGWAESQLRSSCRLPRWICYCEIALQREL